MQNIDLINRRKIQNASDYEDMFIASKDETVEQIANAEWVYKAISEYIEKQKSVIL